MKIEDKKLPQNRYQYTARLSSVEVNDFFEHAATHLAASVKVAGFRPGKAPKNLVREQIDPEKMREEAYSIAVRAAWQEIIKGLKVQPIEDPQVEVGAFEAGKETFLKFEFDVRPEIKVGAWQKITLKEKAAAEVGDKDVDEVIDSLSRGYAASIIKIGPAEKGDKMEVSFTGSVGNLESEKLSAKKFELILGTDSVIPGFAEQLLGLKKNDKKTFTLDFPKDHFDKEFAGKPVTFKAEVDEVYNVIPPKLDTEFAKKFGHQTVAALKSAIKKDLTDRKKTEAFTRQKAQWLAEFEKLIAVEIPNSLIAGEVERTRQSWQEFLASRHLNKEDWLSRQSITKEKLEEDWHKAAASTIKIGLGIAEIAKQSGKDLKEDKDFQDFLDGLVKKSIS
ncbi:MAG TPA: trigger factor [Candidatus Saccharimonadales bacterium]|nr:trigger factor [Candidatus Saccharimonadales bacterium]